MSKSDHALGTGTECDRGVLDHYEIIGRHQGTISHLMEDGGKKVL